MKKLIEVTKSAIRENKELPFSVYISIKEQKIFNVPVAKPLLIFVLSGNKEVGRENKTTCSAGSFIFLSNGSNIDMRNIPDDEEYFALLVEFEYSDFECLKKGDIKRQKYFQGHMGESLKTTLLQFVEWSTFSPRSMWSLRRQELLQLLYHLGFEQVNAIMNSPALSHQLHAIICENIAHDLDADTLSSMLAMSESTLRRKLNAEGCSLQEIKDRAKLGRGLHLVQTTLDPIGRIAEQCGYSSQSRFTGKFKKLFGLTPTELRKTRMRDSGE